MIVKGKKLTVKEYFQKVKNELKDMTWKQRFAHLWEYYKWVLGVLILIICLISIFVTSIVNLNTEIYISGVIVNADLTAEGMSYLTDGYLARKGSTNEKQVQVSYSYIDDPYTTTDTSLTYDMITAIVAMISAKNLDYLIMDEIGMNQFMTPEYGLDLREIFSEEELEAMGTAVIKLTVESTGETIPMAIDIRTTKFAQDHLGTGKPLYLMFISTTVRKDACRDIWDYIVEYGGGLNLESVIAGTTVVEVDQDGQNFLISGYFKKVGGDAGIQTISLSTEICQSEAEGQTLRERLVSGALDYALLDYSALGYLEQPDAFLDLRTIFTEDELEELEVYYMTDPQSGEDIPVALEINASYDLQNYLPGAKKTIIVFAAGTSHRETCRDFWNYIYGTQES